ncbi:MAG: hypothetical protein QME61_03910 [Patescibacteria group bacterium]|nr:hypothetical protein [Patescibacteria group bacterium]
MVTDVSIKYLSDQILEKEKALDLLRQRKNKRWKIGIWMFVLLLYFVGLPGAGIIIDRVTVNSFFTSLILLGVFLGVPFVIYLAANKILYLISWTKSLQYIPLLKTEKDRLNTLKNNFSEAQAKKSQLQLKEDREVKENREKERKMRKIKMGGEEIEVPKF